MTFNYQILSTSIQALLVALRMLVTRMWHKANNSNLIDLFQSHSIPTERSSCILYSGSRLNAVVDYFAKFVHQSIRWTTSAIHIFQTTGTTATPRGWYRL